MSEELRCKIDGDALCIEGRNFVNLQESDAFFIPIPKELQTELESFFNDNKYT